MKTYLALVRDDILPSDLFYTSNVRAVLDITEFKEKRNL